MNKYIKSSVLAMSLAAVVSSCDMDEPTISTLDESSVFSTYSLAEAEVMSIHISFGETNSYRGRFLPYYGLNTDLETGSGTYPSLKDQATDKQGLWNYSTLPTNGQMNTDNNAYAKFYEGIERANLAIEGIRKNGNIEQNKACSACHIAYISANQINRQQPCKLKKQPEQLTETRKNTFIAQAACNPRNQQHQIVYHTQFPESDDKNYHKNQLKPCTCKPQTSSRSQSEKQT